MRRKVNIDIGGPLAGPPHEDASQIIIEGVAH